MVRFLYRAALVNHNPVITLMVFQVVVILAVTQCHITFFGKKQLLNTVLIDHIAAIHSRNRIARTICLLIHHAPLDAVGSIAMLYETAGSKSDARWQI